MNAAKIALDGAVEYSCCRCGEWIREHLAIWATAAGVVGLREGLPHCPQCLPPTQRSRAIPTPTASP
ncbi:MAG TPA: hypothetical protein VML95_04655 [Longimicrobiales bacterium]|jgi:hypothetical protein|nr:hypothetical protein [Longimicrobiales bacterium]